MQTQTMDLTPTWEEILPALVRLYNEADTLDARWTAIEELTKMARLADKYVAQVKALEAASKQAWREAAIEVAAG
jgi:hypothetical protein